MKQNGTKLTYSSIGEYGGLRAKRILALMLALAMMLAMLCAAAEDTSAIGEAAGVEVDVGVEQVEDPIPSQEGIAIDDTSLDGLESDQPTDALLESGYTFEEPVDALVANDSNPADFQIDANGVLVKYVGSGGDVVIPDGVTSIGDRAFDENTSITSVKIPDGVTSIGNFAFYCCSSVTSIGEHAFWGCIKLASLTIPDSVTSIGGHAFDYCRGLTSVTVGAGASIDDLFNSGLLYNKAVAEINVTKYNFAYTVNDGILYTYDMTTLVRCPRTRTSVVIPNKVTNIDNRAFYDCGDLTSLTIGAGINIDQLLDSDILGYTGVLGALTELNTTENNGVYASHEGALYSYDMTTLLRAPAAKAIVTIPDGVTSIGRKAFYKCRTTKAIIPESVTSIAKDAFVRCIDVKIYGVKGSYAQKFAKKAGKKFREYGFGGDIVEMSNCTVTVGEKTYTGKQVKPSVTVMYGDKKLKKGKHYTVKYGKNKAIGEGTVTVKGKGDYTGTVERGFNIYPKKVSGLKLKAGTGKIKASWKKSGGSVTGYELEYSTDPNFTDGITLILEKSSTVKRTLSDLEAGKTYYVRVRAYKDVDDSVYYSAWSSIKKATAK